MTALELSRRIKSGELSVRDALDALYTKIDACDERYRCYTTVSREEAYREADEVQRRPVSYTHLTLPTNREV